MLFLHFQIGDDGFALAADGIVEILPLVELKKARNAPDSVAGSFDYRGRSLPVVDLCELELGRPAKRRLSTRIIVVHLPEDRDAQIGLITENVTETMRCDPADFAPFAAGPHGLVEHVKLESFLPASVQKFVRDNRIDGR